jgi:hypothetical protein
VEKVNRTAEVNQEQGNDARTPWQPPVVEELLVSEAENTSAFGGGDGGVYTS